MSLSTSRLKMYTSLNARRNPPLRKSLSLTGQLLPKQKLEGQFVPGLAAGAVPSRSLTLGSPIAPIPLVISMRNRELQIGGVPAPFSFTRDEDGTERHKTNGRKRESGLPQATAPGNAWRRGGPYPAGGGGPRALPSGAPQPGGGLGGQARAEGPGRQRPETREPGGQHGAGAGGQTDRGHGEPAQGRTQVASRC